MPGPVGHRPAMIVVSVGLAQLLAWGSSFYLLAVLATPIADETGWPPTLVVGGLSVGLVVAGLVSRPVGRRVDGGGGRRVLMGSAVAFSVALTLLATAPSLPWYLGAWVVMGLAMGMGLYDPAFSTISRLEGAGARSAITRVTLIAGFASAVCWPLSLFLVEQLGWRGACVTYAAIQLLVVLPLYRFGLPRDTGDGPSVAARGRDPSAERGRDLSAAPARTPDARAFAALAVVFTVGATVMALISVHLLTLLTDGGMDAAGAVAVGALLGPSQVGARLVEAATGGRHRPLTTLLASTVLVAAGLGLVLLTVAGGIGTAMGAAGVGVVLYGAGSGLRTIARGTVPLALFGPVGYGTLMGRLATPALIGQAIAPVLGAVLVSTLGGVATLAIVAAVAALSVAPVLVLWRATTISGTRSASPP